MKELFKCNNIYDSLQELATGESITITDLKQCSIPTMKCYEEATQIAELGQYYGEPVRLWYYEERSQAEKDAIIANADLKTNQDRYNVLLKRMHLHSIQRGGSPASQHADLVSSYDSDLAEFIALEATLSISYLE